MTLQHVRNCLNRIKNCIPLAEDYQLRGVTISFSDILHIKDEDAHPLEPGDITETINELYHWFEVFEAELDKRLGGMPVEDA